MTALNTATIVRGPAERLLCKIARKARMVEEYERIATEADVTTSRGQQMQEYFRKRAADFRVEQAALEAQFVRMRAGKRRRVSSLPALEQLDGQIHGQSLAGMFSTFEPDKAAVED